MDVEAGDSVACVDVLSAESESEEDAAGADETSDE